jgi:hypothetical protein
MCLHNELSLLALHENVMMKEVRLTEEALDTLCTSITMSENLGISKLHKYKCCCNASIEKLRAKNALITDTLPNYSYAQVMLYSD